MLHICAIVLVSQKKKLGFHKKALIKGLRECTSLRDTERQVVQEILSRSVCASADRTSRVEGNCLRFKEEVRSMERSGNGMKVHRRNM